MKSLKKFLSAVLILLVLNLYLPNITFAEQHHLYAKAGITKHKPETLSTPEEPIPVEVVKKKSYTWLWVVLGVLAVGGAAAAAGGGEEPSSDGDAGSDTGDGGDSGEVTVTW